MADAKLTVDNPFANIEKMLKNPPASGVFVTQVQDDSAAAKTGIERSDVITHLDGKEITDKREFYFSFQPSEDARDHELRVRSSAGEEKTITISPGPLGIGGEIVTKGKPAWVGQAGQRVPAGPFGPCGRYRNLAAQQPGRGACWIRAADDQARG